MRRLTKLKKLTKLTKLITPLAMAICCPAYAAITCTVSVTNINTLFDGFSASDTIATGSYTVTCNRLAGDPLTLNWDLAADNGTNNTGSTNRVAIGSVAPYLSYELYRSSTITGGNRWQLANGLRFAGTASFANTSATNYSSGPQPFTLRMPPNPVIRPAGTYTDLVSVTLRIDGSGTVLDAKTFNVQVAVAQQCKITSPIGDVSFNYQSFQATPNRPTSVIPIRCNDNLAYVVKLDGTTGTLAGLNYTLSLQSATNIQIARNFTGTGNVINSTIYGQIVAGASGICAAPNSSGQCVAQQQRVVTVEW